MRIEKGDIYLADLGDRSMHDIGKIRPVLVFQNNFLNRMIDESAYKDVIIIPLSSQIRENDFTLKIDVRDKIEKESVVLCNAIKMVRADRLLLENGKLTVLRKNEMEKIETILRLLFDM